MAGFIYWDLQQDSRGSLARSTSPLCGIPYQRIIRQQRQSENGSVPNMYVPPTPTLMDGGALVNTERRTHASFVGGRSAGILSTAPQKRLPLELRRRYSTAQHRPQRRNQPPQGTKNIIVAGRCNSYNHCVVQQCSASHPSLYTCKFLAGGQPSTSLLVVSVSSVYPICPRRSCEALIEI